jgi:hypothetical protein
MLSQRGCGLVVLVSLALSGCAAPPAMTPDAGREGGSTDAALLDATAADAGRDASAREAAVDSAVEDASAPVDVVINPGRCGTPVRDCLCGCGANGACQQGCVQSSSTCQDCLYEAITMCCPLENRAFDECVIASMCEDDPCLLERCGTQWTTLQSCARRREREPECLAHVQVCLGPDYPSIQCVTER